MRKTLKEKIRKYVSDNNLKKDMLTYSELEEIASKCQCEVIEVMAWYSNQHNYGQEKKFKERPLVEKMKIVNDICNCAKEIQEGKHIKGAFGYEECKKAIEFATKFWGYSLQQLFENTMDTYTEFTNIVYPATLYIMLVEESIIKGA